MFKVMFSVFIIFLLNLGIFLLISYLLPFELAFWAALAWIATLGARA